MQPSDLQTFFMHHIEALPEPIDAPVPSSLELRRSVDITNHEPWLERFGISSWMLISRQKKSLCLFSPSSRPFRPVGFVVVSDGRTKYGRRRQWRRDTMGQTDRGRTTTTGRTDGQRSTMGWRRWGRHDETDGRYVYYIYTYLYIYIYIYWIWTWGEAVHISLSPAFLKIIIANIHRLHLLKLWLLTFVVIFEKNNC